MRYRVDGNEVIDHKAGTQDRRVVARFDDPARADEYAAHLNKTRKDKA
jgi:hypothetical protein